MAVPGDTANLTECTEPSAGGKAAGWGSPGVVSSLAISLFRCLWVTRDEERVRDMAGTGDSSLAREVWTWWKGQTNRGKLVLSFSSYPYTGSLTQWCVSLQFWGLPRLPQTTFRHSASKPFLLPGLPRNCELKHPQGKNWTQGYFSPRQRKEHQKSPHKQSVHIVKTGQTDLPITPEVKLDHDYGSWVLG